MTDIVEAREVFSKGQRVRVLLSAPQGDRFGTVIGFGHKPHIVRIHFDGLSPRSVHAYHYTFVEAAKEQPATDAVVTT